MPYIPKHLREHWVYLSGPMRGHYLNNYPLFYAWNTYLWERGFKVANPAHNALDPCPQELTPRDDKLLMAEAIRTLAGAEIILFIEYAGAPSQGMMIEDLFATRCGMPRVRVRMDNYGLTAVVRSSIRPETSQSRSSEILNSAYALAKTAKKFPYNWATKFVLPAPTHVPDEEDEDKLTIHKSS